MSLVKHVIDNYVVTLLRSYFMSQLRYRVVPFLCSRVVTLFESSVFVQSRSYVIRKFRYQAVRLLLWTGMLPAGTKRSRARVSAVGFLSHASPWKKRSNRLTLLGQDRHIGESGCWNTRLNGANLNDSCKGISSFVRKFILRACLIDFEKGSQSKAGAAAVDVPTVS